MSRQSASVLPPGKILATWKRGGALVHQTIACEAGLWTHDSQFAGEAMQAFDLMADGVWPDDGTIIPWDSVRAVEIHEFEGVWTQLVYQRPGWPVKKVEFRHTGTADAYEFIRFLGDRLGCDWDERETRIGLGTALYLPMGCLAIGIPLGGILLAMVWSLSLPTQWPLFLLASTSLALIWWALYRVRVRPTCQTLTRTAKQTAHPTRRPIDGPGKTLATWKHGSNQQTYACECGLWTRDHLFVKEVQLSVDQMASGRWPSEGEIIPWDTILAVEVHELEGVSTYVVYARAGGEPRKAEIQHDDRPQADEFIRFLGNQLECDWEERETRMSFGEAIHLPLTCLIGVLCLGGVVLTVPSLLRVSALWPTILVGAIALAAIQWMIYRVGLRPTFQNLRRVPRQAPYRV